MAEKELYERLLLLAIQRLELSVKYEEEWLKFLSRKELEAFRDEQLDKINLYKSKLAKLNRL